GRGPSFVVAVNYEGPADRAWQMWDDGKYDPALIESDLRRARDAGFTAVRVFVQGSLAQDIQAGRWDKLDGFFGAAGRQGVGVILSLYDYSEKDLSKVADVDGRIAARYAGNPSLVSYDVHNETHLSDLLAATYPGGAKAPVQQNGDATLGSYQDLVAKAGAWVAARDYVLSALDYLDSPEGRQWDGLLRSVNASLSMWLQPQLDAIRRADKTHPITASYSDLILARQPANGSLDYVTVHRYPNASPKGIAAATRSLNELRSAFGDKPVLLGEFGFSTATYSPEQSASYETAVYLQLASEGLGGAAKWMLNDFPTGANPQQNAYGAFRSDGSPKPVVAAVRGLSDYLSRNPSPGGQLYVADKPSPGYRWAYEADDALIVSADDYRGTRLSFDSTGLSQLFLTWPDPKIMRIYATSNTQLDIDPGAVMRDAGMGSSFSLVRIDGASRTLVDFSQAGSRLKIGVDGGRTYELSVQRSSAANPSRSLDYDIPNGHFFTQANGRPLGASATGFAVTDDGAARFWSEFQRLGGVQALGYPATGRFVLDGFVTQAFQKVVLQWRPEANQAYFLNTFDLMHDRGLDDWLLTYRQTPRPLDTSPDTGLLWDKVMARHLAFLEQNQVIKARYVADPAWLDHYGLPVSYADEGNSFVIRAQRATFQFWKEDVPWAKAGDVTVANGGDLAKEAYLWPVDAVIPQEAPSR
ncbi:MAG TPA: hypothetical protein VF960_10550, partial [Chloroflexota bacterium]